MKSVKSPSILNRASRALANLAKDKDAMMTIHNMDVIPALIDILSYNDDPNCLQSALRAIRIVCTNSKTKSIAVNRDCFQVAVNLLSSEHKDLLSCTLRLMHEFLKSGNRDIGLRLQEYDGIEPLVQIAQRDNWVDAEMAVDCLYLLASNSHVRVSTGRCGSIEVFTKKIEELKNSKMFERSLQGLCLCAREAVNRNRMRTSGAVAAMVKVLCLDELTRFHESVVCALVCFLFDDLSINVMIRAGLVSGLIKYFQKLTDVEVSEYEEEEKRKRLEIEKKLRDVNSCRDSTGNSTSHCEPAVSPSTLSAEEKVPATESADTQLCSNTSSDSIIPDSLNDSFVSDTSTSQLSFECNIDQNHRRISQSTCQSPPVFLHPANPWPYAAAFPSPETSPYYPNSPSPGCSIGMNTSISPTYSPGSSPPYYYHNSPPRSLSPEHNTLFADSSPGSQSFESLNSRRPPTRDMFSPQHSPPREEWGAYHHQSADGAHAMIHGFRGPVHDVLLLLSRLSRTTDPSRFLVDKTTLFALLNYVSSSQKPNPKCARILNRLTLNPNCFEVMVMQRLVARIYLKLVHGYFVEELTELLDNAHHEEVLGELESTESSSRISATDCSSGIKNTQSEDAKSSVTYGTCLSLNALMEYINKSKTESCNEINIKSCDSIEKKETISAKPDSETDTHLLPRQHSGCEETFKGIGVFKHSERKPTADMLRTGELLMSNLRAQTESSYGKGVLAHIMLTGSKASRESCSVALPLICR